MWDHLLTHSLLGTSELEEARGISIWRTGWKISRLIHSKKGCRGRFFKFVPESTFHTYSWKKETFWATDMGICMYMYVHRSSDVFYPICCRTSFRSRRFLMEEETPFSAAIRGNKWILLSSHLLIRFFLCLFCSWPMTTVPLLEDRSGSLNYWFRSSRRRKRMYVCEEEWELATSTNTSLSISRVSTMATMGLALSSRSNVCSTPTILTKCSDNTLNTHNTLTIHAALVISEHIFLCWRVCFF